MLKTTRQSKPSPRMTGIKNQRKTQAKTNSKKAIKTKEAYQITMKEIDSLMKRGEDNLSEKELDRLGILAEAAESYEDIHDPLPVPATLPEMIRLRMFQMQLNQGFAAKLLGVSDTKLSMIMNGKQKPDIHFIKAIHDKLHVDANLILKAI